MRLTLLFCFTMIAFAANSILTRMAVEAGEIDPVSFAVIRVFSGAAILCALVLWKSGRLPWRARNRLIGATSLAAYMIGFSLAYVSLDAGLGALILFGVVQITMFSYGAIFGARPLPRQLIGAGVAFVGLLIALWPEPGAPQELIGAAFMVLAGLGWAVYTLSAKSSGNPLAATAANFLLCFPLLGVVALPFVDHVSSAGVLMAVLCGAVTSGLGYALWYRVLAEVQQGVAAVVQLSVPILAILGGAVVLGEDLTPSVLIAAAFVLAGIGLAVTSRPAPVDHS